MISLFRNIRHSLISGGKTTHYMKYAKGEIVHAAIDKIIALTKT